ncbi:MAG TPA: hypothetical protein PKB11_15155 [Desulfovibrio sp.]|uniref:hypothetical protein n=1 Tax=Desulfovibrio sp. TaxID=885 RepID=UPI002BD0CE6D|nr:hypothetical protein [Desulfovibrio sp.]HMM40095.1 hypothetical protein [Desulfovibrio sp.]
MHRGYVQLWRRSLSSEAWRDPKLWRLWTYCLLKASHKPHQVVVGRQAVDLEPGQFVLTRRNAAQDTGLTQAEVRSLLGLAEKLGMIARRSTNQYTVVSLVNWPRYQQVPPTAHQPRAGAAPASRPSTNPSENDQAQLRDFERFWAAYPKKTNRKAALAAWRAVDTPPLDRLLAALAAQSASPQWAREQGRFIPNPASWISQARWTDQPAPQTPNPSTLLAWARTGDQS